MPMKNTSIRALILIGLVLLLSISGTQAQDTDVPPGFLRTIEDIEAAQKLDEGMPSMEDIMRYLPRGEEALISHYVIPRTIRVGITPTLHCSVWLDMGRPVTEVIEIPFNEYVKNVVPNEWVYTWHEESLKAGAMAAKTFAWWRIHVTTLYPGVYRPEGVDVVNNTCDQVFIANSSRSTTDAAVDQTWRLRMHRDNIIDNVHYLKNDDYCEQSIVYPCMGQENSQEMALEGYTFDQILHHYYDFIDDPISIDLTSEIPAGENVVLNNNFNQDMLHWQTFGEFGGLNVSDGVLNFFRQNASQSTVVFQDIDYQVYPYSKMQTAIKLGNSSNVTKYVDVHIHNVDDWDGVLSCQFELPPNMPPLLYELWGETSTYWRAIRVEIHAASADGLAAYQVDRVTLRYRPDVNITKGCIEPVPGRPKVVSPVANGEVPRSFNLQLQAGKSNYRVGYSPEYHVQVSTNINFTNLVYDNAGNHSKSLKIPLSLPLGSYYVRARQFDGIDRWSEWRNPRLFHVRPIPDKPVLQTPGINDLDENTVVFRWTHGIDADQYKLILRTNLNQTIAKRNFSIAQANCDTICKVSLSSLGVALEEQYTYKWKVKAINNAGYVTKAKNKRFTVVSPGIPHLQTPANNASATPTSTLMWTRVNTANLYKLVIKAPDGTKVSKVKADPTAFNCSGATCSLPLAALNGNFVDGVTYKWIVKAIRTTTPTKAKGKSEKWTFTYQSTAPLSPPENTFRN